MPVDALPLKTIFWDAVKHERIVMTRLFDSMQLGSLELPNRIAMAPLTRARAGREGIPNELMAAYYAQRASAGLIISEATGISREGLGWPNAPGAGLRIDPVVANGPDNRIGVMKLAM